jgi:hypothetical protein
MAGIAIIRRDRAKSVRHRYSGAWKLILEVRDAEEGGYCARALGHAIFTEAETSEELRANVLEAASLHFEDGQVRPSLVQRSQRSDKLEVWGK